MEFKLCYQTTVDDDDDDDDDFRFSNVSIHEGNLHQNTITLT